MASGAGGVRAHSPVAEGSRAGVAGKPGVLGIRREDKNKWERRAPLAPKHVNALVQQGIKVVIQPSFRRVFTDDEYRAAGGVISEDLMECSTIAAVKEVPVDLLLPARNWLMFSHTIKAQPYSMALLDDAMKKKVRLVDYECITSTGQRGAPRLVAFGAFAGHAGAIDFLRGMGERFLALGFATPLLHIGSSFMYPSLDNACRAVTRAGQAIASKGLPPALCPFTVVFTGKGNVSMGALKIFQLMPHEMVDPADLPALCAAGAKANTRKLYLCIATAEHMVRRKDGAPFQKEVYYAEPDAHESIFQDTILPHCTAIVNGMYWDARFPKLFTQEDLARHVRQDRDKLLGVEDITCDEDGSVPTKQFTSIEEPFFIYNALDDTVSNSLDGPGVLFHAVDHLPSELPREATEHFGDKLLPFLPSLVWGKDLAPPIQGAIICEGGELTPNFEYITQLRRLNEEHEVGGGNGYHALRPHAFHAPPASVTLDLTGHLFDTRLINKVCDLAESNKAKIQILHLDVGSTIGDPSTVSVLIMTHSEDQLQKLISQISAATTDAKSTMRRAGPQSPDDLKPKGQTLPRRSVLVLGAGFVVGPLVEYLLRRPENALTVAGMEKLQVEALAERFGARVKAEVIDITSLEASAVAQCEALVKDHDLIVSLVPATLHVGIAKLVIQHKKHMVTASYVSPEMQSLDADARAANVLILNEVGLDPGLDHMSAMKMIDGVKASGGQVMSFSSLCGGLPAPEVAGCNPIGYKFSWSPKGVLLAARNSASYKKAGVLTEIKGPDLLASAQPVMVNNALAFDVLPNRDSTAFAELYGLADTPTFFRGTYRYRGFCDRMLALARLGLLEPGPIPALQGCAAWPCRCWLAQLLGLSAAKSITEEALQHALNSRLGELADAGISFLSWLGLCGDGFLPGAAPVDSPLDVVAQLLQRSETAYEPSERDMVAMQHELIVKRKGSSGMERHTSTLLEYGEPFGDSAMSRTVGITAAICAQLVLDTPRQFGSGVQRPLEKKWYDPVLERLEGEGIAMKEACEQIQDIPSAKL